MRAICLSRSHAALVSKVSDEFTVCHGHHREVHRIGLEKNWWTSLRIDAIDTARKLWIETHPFAAP